jgi:hypothetical protein
MAPEILPAIVLDRLAAASRRRPRPQTITRQSKTSDPALTGVCEKSITGQRVRITRRRQNTVIDVGVKHIVFALGEAG